MPCRTVAGVADEKNVFHELLGSMGGRPPLGVVVALNSDPATSMEQDEDGEVWKRLGLDELKSGTHTDVTRTWHYHYVLRAILLRRWSAGTFALNVSGAVSGHDGDDGVHRVDQRQACRADMTKS